MKTAKPIILSFALIIFYPSIGQKFIIQETNIGKKNTASQYLNLAKKCKLVLLKKQTLYTLPISSKSTLTNNSINALADKFTDGFPKGIDPLKSDERVIERGYENKREDVVQLTYCVLPANQYTTTDYIQMTVYFDSSGPNPLISNIEVKSIASLGIITLTEREIHPPVVKAPVTKASAIKKPSTKKPATKSPAAKKPSVKKKP